ncbi:MAG: beta-ketoacyl synthase N-terminal-like domain-containing protein [Pseudomonadota bacterium]|nr:beta-ketoacyl synthase N-terminal-like domain-containing protein [Pseudomonadota bacterium]
MTDIDDSFDDDAWDNSIAVVGMSGSFPGAEDINQYWDHIVHGRCLVSELSDNDLINAGVPPQLIENPNYVKRSGILDNVECFDAEFFGYGRDEAETIDPQQRLFLEHAWKALESAGYRPREIQEPVGVFAGCGWNRYAINNLDFDLSSFGVSDFQKMLNNDKDFLATRVAYKLNLKGPALDIQTACSTSLVTIQTGMLSLLTYQCDMALCGGVYVNIPHGGGYLYSEGLIMSKDGYCRPFSPNANGTIFSEGVGVVVLKRYADAVEQGDSILAVIRGAAVNNDGADKVGYTAPSVSGQADVIELALQLANLSPSDLDYIETHGTGTKLGDPIEMSALERVFGSNADKHIGLGTLKANIGHLDAAAGVASFIKAVCVAKTKVIPPNLYAQDSKPEYHGEGPFYFTASAIELNSKENVNVGVSSFGVGGTNAHIIVSSPPSVEHAHPFGCTIRPLLYSAKSEYSLREIQKKTDQYIVGRLDEAEGCANTLLNHRTPFEFRTHSVLDVGEDEHSDAKIVPSGKVQKAMDAPKNAFMFSGQGSQFHRMGCELYAGDNRYRNYLDQCIEAMQTDLASEVKQALLGTDYPDRRILDTQIAQLCLFTLEYSLARTLMDYGIKPDVLIGHSLGEFSAACIANVFSLPDAVTIVSERGRLMASTDEGAMVAVLAPRSKIEPMLFGSLAVSVENSPLNTVISGTVEDVQSLEQKLKPEKLACVKLATRFPFHSRFMEPILEAFRSVFAGITLHPPEIPIVCCTAVGGSAESVTEPFVNAEYWVQHLRKEVNFHQGTQRLIDQYAADNLIEIGPGDALINFVRTITLDRVNLIQTLPGAKMSANALELFVSSMAQLWCTGVNVDFAKAGLVGSSAVVDLPTYQFQRTPFWRNERSAAAFSKPNAPTFPPVNTTSFAEEVEEQDAHKEIRDVWERYIQKPEYSDDDSYFDLGGHSLNGVQLISELNKRYNRNVEISDFFDHPTFNHLLKAYGITSADNGEESVQAAPHSASASEADIHQLQYHGANQPTKIWMQESRLAKWVLARLYGPSRMTIRRVLERIIFKLEGGELFSVTVRKLYKKFYDMDIGHYTAGCFDKGNFKPGTSIGRYSSITPTARFETADHPSTTVSSSGLFYRESFGFSDGMDIPRTKIVIGNDVFIGHNATLVYPCSKVGDGAIIGAGTIVNFDVPPYAIVGGSPAMIIRYRFPKAKIEALLESRWWENDLEQLYPARGEFMKPVSGSRIR